MLLSDKKGIKDGVKEGVELHSIFEDPRDGSKVMSFVGINRQNSLMLKTSPNSSLAIFKDDGFSESDLDQIIEGYEQAFGSAGGRLDKSV